MFSKAMAFTGDHCLEEAEIWTDRGEIVEGEWMELEGGYLSMFIDYTNASMSRSEQRIVGVSGPTRGYR
jgi:hypothetical protein